MFGMMASRNNQRKENPGPNFTNLATCVYLENRIKNAEYRKQNIEDKVQNTEYRIQNKEYRVQSTDHRIQNTEYRIQNTEYRMQNTEYRIQTLMHIKLPLYLFFYMALLITLMRANQLLVTLDGEGGGGVP
jgi:hypothetical protein